MGQILPEHLSNLVGGLEPLFTILREHIPGFEQAQLKAVAPLLGVRETRRIVADSMMTVEDLSRGQEFADTIGFSMYGWDLPDVKKPSEQPFANDSQAGYKYKVKKGLSKSSDAPERTVLSPLMILAA